LNNIKVRILKSSDIVGAGEIGTIIERVEDEYTVHFNNSCMYLFLTIDDFEVIYYE